jgi:beta-fructofuranosidase
MHPTVRLKVFLLLATAACLFGCPPRAHGQLYAVKPPRTVWDSWLFRDGADYHLFYLQGPRDDRHIGRAVSQDLLHWKRLPWIDSVDHGDGWDRKITHTGFTVKIGGRYACLYGSSGTGRQLNGVMFSNDLLHWEKYPGNPVLVSTPPHYGGQDWRDPATYYDADDGLWHGFICAQTASHQPAAPKVPQVTDKTLSRNTPCIGHFTSKDLVHWDYLPPVYEDAEFADLEVPDYFTQGGWHYLLFSSARTRRDTPSRRQATGTFYVMSEHRDGPYRLPPDPLILGSGNGRLDNYVGRALPDGDGHLLYHHTVGGVVVWGTIKQIVQNEDGTLRLEYWPGLDGLETGVINMDATEGASDLFVSGNWRKQADAVVGQANPATPAVCRLPCETADMMLTCRMEGGENSRGGVVCRLDDEQGIAVCVDRVERTVQILDFRRAGDRYNSRVLETRYEAPLTDGANHLRVLTRDRRLEVYVNDQWMFGITMADSFRGTGVGLLVDSGTVQFRDLRIAEIEPLIPCDP